MKPWILQAPVLAGLVLACGSTSCRKSHREEDTKMFVPPVVAPELGSNAMAGLPGAVYHGQVRSPIHWQAWTPETLARARASKRLLFAVIALPQQPGYNRVLSEIGRDAALVSTINNEYVPVLIDGDASREIGLLTGDLCSEIKQPLQLPLLLWLSPDGNPVAWIPATNKPGVKIADLFAQSHSMIGRTWLDDPDYITKNSGLDNGTRRARFEGRKNHKVMSEQPAQDALRAIRQLASFYDPASRSFDEAGGLFPASALDLMATVAMHPGVPAELRGRCLDTTRELSIDLLTSAMFDPLEGGLFTSRRGNSWSLPVFSRDCVSQGRAAVALLDAYRATHNEHTLSKALGLISFAEKNFKTSEGLFGVGVTDESPPAAWLWSVEEIEKELSPADAAWWIKVTGMKGLGNLPSEADPRREYFRSNSLSNGKTLQELATDAGVTQQAIEQRYDFVRKSLLKIRDTRLGTMERDDTSHAGATFRMISAYAAAYGATGDARYRDQARDLLEKARTAFSEGPRLRLFSKPTPPSIGTGRAFLYALAMQSAMDVAAITGDNQWIDWSEDLASTATELFAATDFLKECPDDAKIVDLPVTDLIMLFDDSTAGLISMAECRLASQERPLVATFSELATPLPTYSVDRPILHTDLLQATISREFEVSVVLGTGLSAELKEAVERLPMRMVHRRQAKTSDAVPAGSVKVVLGSGEAMEASTPAALQQAVLPSAPKS